MREGMGVSLEEVGGGPEDGLDGEGVLSPLSPGPHGPLPPRMDIRSLMVGQLEVESMVSWSSRHFVLTPAALELFQTNTTTPTDVVLVEDIQGVVASKENEQEVVIQIANAACHALQRFPTPEVSILTLRLRSREVCEEFMEMVKEARINHWAVHRWQQRGFPVPAPVVTALHVGVQMVPGLAAEYTAARGLQQGQSFTAAHVFGFHTRLHFALTTPIGACTLDLKGGRLIQQAVQGRQYDTQQQLVCFLGQRQIDCMFKVRLGVKADTTPLSIACGVVLAAVVAAALVLARGALGWLGGGGDTGSGWLLGMWVLLWAGLVAAAAAAHEHSPTGRLLVRRLMGQELRIELRRMHLAQKPVSGAQTFQALCDGEVPVRFADGSPDDPEEARRRWAVSCEYKRKHNVFHLLQTPQPLFDTFCKIYPMYYHKCDKQGRFVAIEKISELKHSIRLLKEHDISLQDVLNHTAFITEFFWTHIDPGRMPGGKMVRILDVKGVEVMDITTEILAFIRDVGHMIGHCYPERQAQIFIVNVPSMFHAVYRLVSPLIRPITRKKIRLVTAKEVQATLLEVIDADSLPEEYGGTCRCEGPHGCHGGAEQQQQLLRYVEDLNVRAARGELDPLPADPHERFLRMRDNALFMAQ